MNSPRNYKELEKFISQEIKDGLGLLAETNQQAIDNIANNLTSHIAEFVGYKHVELRERDKKEKRDAK